MFGGSKQAGVIIVGCYTVLYSFCSVFPTVIVAHVYFVDSVYADMLHTYSHTSCACTD